MSLRLIVFGNNYKGQLGIGESKVIPTKPMTPREKEFAAVQRIPLPYSISKLGNPTIKKVATGSYFTFLVTTDNKVFCFGENLFGQLGVEVEGSVVFEPHTIPAFKDVDIEDVSCGFYFTLFHARNGNVYGCGNNSFGQLGLGTNTDKVRQPLMIDPKTWTDQNNHLHNIVMISAGENHSAFLSDRQMVFTCGFNDKGQLGNDTRDNNNVPALIPGKVNKEITFIQCGSNHTAMMNKHGEVFFCGDNQNGQFGVGPDIDESPIPIQMQVPSNQIVRTLITTYDHTHIITTEGEMYGCGRGTDGQLFGEEASNQTTLVKCNLPEMLDIDNIESISHGPYITSITTKNNDVFICGGNSHNQVGIADAKEKQEQLVPLPRERIYADTQRNCKLRVAAGECHTILYFVSDTLNVVLTHFQNLRDERVQNFCTDIDIICEDADEEEGRPKKRQRTKY